MQFAYTVCLCDSCNFQNELKDFPINTVNINSLAQRFSNFFQVGTTFISQNVLRTTLLLGLSNSLGLPKQCSKHVFATENPSFVVESRVSRVVNFIKCQSWERKFKDACCM